MVSDSKWKLSKLSEFNTTSTPEMKDIVRENKRKELEIVAERDIPMDKRSYTIFESAEERMLRLEIKYYRSIIANSEQTETDTLEHLKSVIEKFRRLKYRMEKRYQRSAAEELAFPEHYALGEGSMLEQDGEFEDLLDYLRKKSEERRLKAIDQVDDNKIN